MLIAVVFEVKVDTKCFEAKNKRLSMNVNSVISFKILFASVLNEEIPLYKLILFFLLIITMNA